MGPRRLITDGEAALSACLAAFARTPRAGALLCDIDGTISPIAPRPADAAVPARTAALLAALTDRLGLVAVLTGRALEDGRRMIPLDGAVYVGTHGLELRDRDGRVTSDPRAEPYVAAVREMAATAARDLDCAALGIVLEDKRTVLAVHYRTATDAEAARHAILTTIVAPARARGLAVSTGHFAFEIKPPLAVSKGLAARRLLDDGPFLTALFCGDDLTDVTGFRAIHEWAGGDARRTACALAAVTGETPPPVLDEADVRVAATPGVHEALTRLLAAVGG